MNEIRIDVGATQILIVGSYELSIEENRIRVVSNEPNKQFIDKEKSSKQPEHEEIKEPFYDLERLRNGSESLYGLVETWKQGFDIDGAHQPNRMEALRECIMHSGDSLLLYLRKSVGLTNAIYTLFPPLPGAGHLQMVEHAKFIRKISCNIAQVSSIACPEVSDFLEPHVNYLEQKFFW